MLKDPYVNSEQTNQARSFPIVFLLSAQSFRESKPQQLENSEPPYHNLEACINNHTFPQSCELYHITPPNAISTEFDALFCKYVFLPYENPCTSNHSKASSPKTSLLPSKLSHLILKVQVPYSSLVNFLRSKSPKP